MGSKYFLKRKIKTFMEMSNLYLPKILSCYVGDTSVQFPILS